MRQQQGLMLLLAMASCAFIAGVCWLFYFLWNEIAAGVFGAPELTFWQSVGLVVLVSMLTNGLRLAINKNQ